MITLAEIADKMPSLPRMWACMAILAVPFLIGLVRRWLAWMLLTMALFLSCTMAYYAYHEAFVEVGMKQAIRNEMGMWWITNSISSALLPLAVAVAVLLSKKNSQRINT